MIIFDDEKNAREYITKLKTNDISATLVKRDKQYEVRIKPEFKCPFCGDTGFSRMGLKSHLEEGDCKDYNDSEKLAEKQKYVYNL